MHPPDYPVWPGQPERGTGRFKIELSNLLTNTLEFRE